MFPLSRHLHPGSALTFDILGWPPVTPFFIPFTLRHQSSKGSKNFKVLPAHLGIAPEAHISEAFEKGITAEWDQPSQRRSVVYGLQMAGLEASVHPGRKSGINIGPRPHRRSFSRFRRYTLPFLCQFSKVNPIPMLPTMIGLAPFFEYPSPRQIFPGCKSS